MDTAILNHEARVEPPVAEALSQIRGSLTLDFERDVRSGTTFLATSAQEPPLRIVRPFRREDGSVLVHLHNVSGGLLGGDLLRMSVNIGPRASVQLTSTGATRVYRSRGNCSVATQINRITIAENALLEYVPDSIIPYAGSRFRQDTKIDLNQGAGLFWWEILAPGRTARGEMFEYEDLEFTTDVAVEGAKIVAERFRLQPKLHELSSPARIGHYRYWITFYIVRVGLDTGTWITAENKVREVLRQFQRRGESFWGISTLAAHGLSIRGLTIRGWDLLSTLREVWNAAKLILYGCEAILPRKVN